MFKRKECSKCNKKVSESTNYCPNCGNSFGEDGNNFGMLGRDDNVNPFGNMDEFSNSLFGGVGKNIFSKMLGSAMKMMEKEMQREMNNPNLGNMPRTNFELFVNGKRISPDKIKISHGRVQKNPQKKIVSFTAKHFSEEQQKKFSALKKEEPKTNVKRLSDRIIYEVDVPGVKSIGDVSLIQLENNIEIKAISKNKAYSKKLPINLPISSYDFSDEKLILELGIMD